MADDGDGKAAKGRRKRGAGAAPGDGDAVGRALSRIHEGVFEARVFEFETDELRMVELPDGRPVFVVADMAIVIGANVSAVVAPLADDEKGLIKIITPGGLQDLVVVTESGFYALVLRSHGAMNVGTKEYRFRRWTTGVVLPEIRRTGRYGGSAESLPGSDRDLSATPSARTP